MKVMAAVSQLDEAKASFRTHLNYIKRINYLLDKSKLTINGSSEGGIAEDKVKSFWKLQKVTHASIQKDVELAKEDPAFSIIAAPWLPVKCYYALYYIESVLMNVTDGCLYGFGKGGHAGIRKKMGTMAKTGNFVCSMPTLSKAISLGEIQAMPSINPGQNARTDFWQHPDCNNSIAKKLLDYKLHDAKLGRKWNLRTKKHQTEQKDFITNESLMLLDFFYWYRIKANYRDLDYIDFENGISEAEVLEYMGTYYQAYRRYREMLIYAVFSFKAANILIQTPKESHRNAWG